MDEQIDSKLILEAVHALGVDVPVMSTRIVGDRLELYLYGGQVRIYTPPEMAIFDEAPEPSPVKAVSSIADYLHPGIRDLESMNLVALRDLAQRWKVPGWNRLGKAKLIDALRNVRA